MKRIVDFVRDRLAEPGTHRSLAVVLFAISGAGNSQEAWEAAVYLCIAGLGAYSAAKPESK
jgi:hypothetical protein